MFINRMRKCVQTLAAQCASSCRSFISNCVEQFEHSLKRHTLTISKAILINVKRAQERERERKCIFFPFRCRHRLWNLASIRADTTTIFGGTGKCNIRAV